MRHRQLRKNDRSRNELTGQIPGLDEVGDDLDFLSPNIRFHIVVQEVGRVGLVLDKTGSVAARLGKRERYGCGRLMGEDNQDQSAHLQFGP